MRHNQVVLCGVIQDAPKIRKSGDGKVFAQFRVITINGNRTGGRQIEAKAFDAPLIHTTNPDLIGQIEKIEVGDFVLIKGAVTTATVTRAPKCQHCGERQTINGILSYISPASVNIISKGAALNSAGAFDRGVAVEKLKAFKEVSNICTVVGVVCREPQPYKSDEKHKRKITSYQLAIKRKLRIIGEIDDNTADFPWVKSYGKIGMNDGLYIKKGTFMFIDGWIRARKFERKAICQHCGQEMSWIDVSQNIVPYASEYIKDYRDPAEITEQDKNEYNKKRVHIETEDSMDEYKTISKEEQVEAEKILDSMSARLANSDNDIENDDTVSQDSDDTAFLDIDTLKKRLNEKK